MNCKNFLSKILAFFTSLAFVSLAHSESFGTYVYFKPGDSFIYEYTQDMTLVASYKALALTCPAGKVYEDGDWADCPAGYFCVGGGTSEVGCAIEKCAPGFPNSEVGSSNIADCYIVSEAGKYVDGYDGLKECPVGYYCPGGDKFFDGDDVGLGGRKTCEDLNYAGLDWTDNSNMTGLSSSDHCETTIAAGAYFDAASQTIKSCPENTKSEQHVVAYGNVAAGTSCEPCPLGYTTNGKTGAVSCEVVEYNVVLNANGGVITGGSSASNRKCTVDSDAVSLPTPTKTGYTFRGWYTNSSLTGATVTKIAAGECTENFNLYAKWEANEYTVSFDAAGGIGGQVSVEAVYGEMLPDLTALPTMDGYKFNGYYFGEKQYYDMEGKAIAAWDLDEDGVLVAQWVADGVCAPGTYYNQTTGLIESCPAGSYCPGGTGTDCYALTCPTNYPNSVAGASKEGDCYKEQKYCSCITDGAACPGRSCAYNTFGSFNGVVYSGTTDCVASPGESEEAYCELVGAYCYGHLDNNMVGEYFDGDLLSGGCRTCDFTGTYMGETLTFSNSNRQDTSPENGSAACYAIVALPCTVPVCPLEGTGVCSYDSSSKRDGAGFLSYGSSVPRPGPGQVNYMCPDASFTCNVGYDKNQNANIDPTDSVADTAAKDLCTPHVYTVELNGNSGTPASKLVYQKYNTGWFSNETATNQITSLPVPTYEYYTFRGYYTKQYATEVGYAQVTDENGRFISAETKYKNAQLTEDVVLYAQWELNTYTVRYNANGGTGTMDNVVHKCTESKNLTPNAFTSATNNREFLGWSMEAGATEPQYEDGASVVNLTNKNGATVTLYAVWKDCVKCANGVDATCSLTAPLGVCTYETACATHYEKLQNAGKYNPTCSAVKYGITYETGGGVISSDFNKVTDCTVVSGVIVLPTAEQITLTDNRFDGWYDNSSYTGSRITSLPAGSCTANKTLYAKWVVNVEVCQAGKYYNGTSFVDCPKGSYCPGEGKVTIGVPGCSKSCPEGYVDGGTGYVNESQCQITVPQGSYLGTKKGTQMTVCQEGTYTSADKKVAYGETSSCTSCEANNYCTAGTKYSCATKTSGVFVNSAENSGSVNDCYAMTEAGKYIEDNTVKTCAAPYYCPGGIKVMYNKTGGSKSCSELSSTANWQSGITTSGVATPDQCYVSVDAGYYWDGGKSVACSEGTQKAAHQVYYGQTSSCDGCPAGYTSDAGMSECYLMTQPGKYVQVAGKGMVTCKAGDFCPGGIKVKDTGVGGNTACTTLGAAYTSAAGTSSADMCYKECVASAVDNATQVSGNDYYGVSVKDTCVATLCKAGFTVASGACSVCPADSVCDPSVDAGKPRTCSELTNGVYTKSDVQNGSAAGCYLVTEAGKYVATAGSGQTTCAKNGYCAGGDKITSTGTGGRKDCPTGYAASDAGASAAEQCYTTCSLVEHAIEMSGRDYYGAGKDTCEATKCDTGYVLANGMCGGCPAGSVCDPNYDDGKVHSCSELTGGKYTMSDKNTVSVDGCYVYTAAGKYVAVAKQGEVSCGVGDYCPGNVKVMYSNVGGNVACSVFGAGYSSDVGAAVETDCYQRCALSENAQQMSGRDYYGTDSKDTCEIAVCKAGFTLSNGVCVACPADSVCDPSIDVSKPRTCSELTNGVYTKSDVQNGSVAGCYLVTEAGKYVATAGSGLTTCSKNGFCAGGVKVTYAGTGGREACPGEFAMSDEGATSAQQCYASCSLAANAMEMSGRDYYGTSATDTCVATLCKAGFTLSAGACEVCPADSVCDPSVDAGKPRTCSELTNGVYTKSDVQNGSVAGCYLVTEVGKYVATAGSGQTTCAKNGYCTGGIKVTYASIGGRETCPNGYAASDAGASAAEQCYTSCSTEGNAQTVLGRDYYGNGQDTCGVSSCKPGFTVVGGVCEVCPANHVCHPDVEAGTPKLCSVLTNSEHIFAAAGSDQISDCYAMCEAYDIEYGQAVPLADKEFYPAQCRFKGESVTGNPCNIVNGVCVETSCRYDYEMIGGRCSPCVRSNAVSYKQNGGNCVVEACVVGFHPNGQSCESNVAECSVPNAVSAERVWNSAKQAFGECVALECEDGYHLGGNICQADEQVCELEHGVGVREWNHKTGKWGDCIATKCDPGYTNDRSQTNELWKQCGRCNNMYSAGGELAASSYVDGCEIASCMYEGELYTLDNNECVLICDTYSDETGSRKWNASRKKCERTCTPGYMAW